MGKKNKQNKKQLNNIKKDDIREEIFSEIKEKKENMHSERDDKSDLLSEIIEESKNESSSSDEKNADEKESDKEEAADKNKNGKDEKSADKSKNGKDEEVEDKSKNGEYEESANKSKNREDEELAEKSKNRKDEQSAKDNKDEKHDKYSGEKESNRDEHAVDEEAENKTDEAAVALALDEPIPYIDSSVLTYKKKKKIAKIATIATLSVIAAVYIGGVIVSSLFFYANTRINGIDVSGKNMQEAERLVTNDMNTYCLEIDFSNGTEEVRVGDGGLTLSLKESIKDIKKKQQPFLWFLHFGRSYEYEVGFNASFDEEQMDNYLMTYREMQSQNMKKSKNAEVDMSTGVAVIIPDETGTELNTENVCTVIRESISNGEAVVDIAEEGCYIEAPIQEDDAAVTNGLKQAKAFLDIDAAYDFNGYKIEIPKEELAKMAYLDKNGDLQISKEAVFDYAARFSEKYTTVDTDRKFKTHDGKIIGIHGKYYGWIIDGETEAEELYELICKKESFTKEPAYKKSAYAMGDMNDIGYTYIEVDLTNQHLYFYEKGVLSMETDVVTGWLYNPNNYKTPGGLYLVDNKAAPATLVGANYETPVNYWMGFNGGIGLHDATWRSEFGGDIYMYNGSHGCVNLPLSFAREFYPKVETGMPVVCYWRDEVEYFDE